VWLLKGYGIGLLKVAEAEKNWNDGVEHVKAQESFSNY